MLIKFLCFEVVTVINFVYSIITFFPLIIFLLVIRTSSEVIRFKGSPKGKMVSGTGSAA